jgi:lipid-binding SYLF domain-containing protein
MTLVRRFALIVSTATVGFTLAASAAESDKIVTVYAEDSNEVATVQPAENDEVAAAKAAAQQVVEDAIATLQNFEADNAQAWFRENVSKARALFIVPRVGGGGFIFGGSGGRGLVVAKDVETGTWSQPAFYTVGSASIGLQAGAHESEVIYLVMSDSGMSALMSTKFQVGADGTVVGGPGGIGAQAATSDVLSFSRGQGLYGGITAEGSVIHPDFKRNTAYYGEPVSATEILLKNAVRNIDADGLVAQVSATAAPK